MGYCSGHARSAQDCQDGADGADGATGVLERRPNILTETGWAISKTSNKAKSEATNDPQGVRRDCGFIGRCDDYWDRPIGQRCDRRQVHGQKTSG